MLVVTQRLTLRPMAESDFEDFSAYASDAEVWRSLAFEALKDRAAVRASFDKMLGRGEAYAVVYEGRMIGHIDVEPLRPSLIGNEQLRGKTGVSLSCAVTRACQRQGFMREAMTGMIRYLFEQEGYDFVNAGYATFNEPSRALQESLGFTYISSHPYRRGEQEYTIREGVLFRESFAQIGTD